MLMSLLLLSPLVFPVGLLLWVVFSLPVVDRDLELPSPAFSCSGSCLSLGWVSAKCWQWRPVLHVSKPAPHLLAKAAISANIVVPWQSVWCLLWARAEAPWGAITSRLASSCKIMLFQRCIRVSFLMLEEHMQCLNILPGLPIRASFPSFRIRGWDQYRHRRVSSHREHEHSSPASPEGIDTQTKASSAFGSLEYLNMRSCYRKHLCP